MSTSTGNTTSTPVTHHPEARRRLGVTAITFMIIAASAPLTVLAGGVPTTLAITGIIGVPLSFVIIGVVLALFVVGYVAMSRSVVNAGAFYAYVSQGSGRAAGVGAAMVALVAYNAMQIGIYGLFGYTVASQFQAWFGIEMPWWVPAIVGIVIAGVLGVNRVDLSAKVLGVLVALEFLVVTVYDVSAFAFAPEGVTFAPLQPANLFVPGVGIVLASAFAAFMGFESGAIYGEEAKDHRRTVPRATYLAVAIIAIFYALSAWAMTLAAGPSQVAEAAATQGPGLVFGFMAEHLGQLAADLAQVLFITSVFASFVSFHNAVARYYFSLGREGVLPSKLGALGRRSGAPYVGSLTQTVTALVVVTGFVLASFSWTPPEGVPVSLFPILTLFAWLTTTGALGLVVLMLLVSIAVVGYFRKRPQDATVWQRLAAPILAALALSVTMVLVVVNFNTLLTSDPTAPPTVATFVLPALLAIAGVAGVVWGVILRRRSPEIYRRIGHGADLEENRLIADS